MNDFSEVGSAQHSCAQALATGVPQADCLWRLVDENNDKFHEESLQRRACCYLQQMILHKGLHTGPVELEEILRSEIKAIKLRVAAE